MINYCEEISGNLKIVSESGAANYMPTSPSWRLLGWDRELVCFQYPNGQINLFDGSGRWVAQTQLASTDEIRNYTNGFIYFRDTRLGINYRLDPVRGQRFQMA